MTNDNRIEETLSALMDSEAQELEVRRAIKGVSENSELRDTWHRYQLASAAMKRDLPPRMFDVSQRISAALEQEPVYKPSLRTFIQPLGKVAVAASVALVAVFGVQQLQYSNPQSQPSPQVAEAGNGLSGAPQFQLPAGYDLPPVAARTVSAGRDAEAQSRPSLLVSRNPVVNPANEQEIRDYLNSLMERHTRNAAYSSSNQGILPLARLPQVEEGRH